MLRHRAEYAAFFVRKNEIAGAAELKSRENAETEMRRRGTITAENAGVYFLRKSADHEKIPVSSPEWKEKLPWLETERDCRIHVGVADRRD